MRRNIFEPVIKQSIYNRIDNLNADSKGKWGRLTAAQMIRHLSESNRMATGEIQMPDRSNVFTRTIVKWMFLQNIKPPGREKGNIKTFPEVDVLQRGLEINDIETEKGNYKTGLEQISSRLTLHPFHTIFGKMTRNDWGCLLYAHADYHLSQFDR